MVGWKPRSSYIDHRDYRGIDTVFETFVLYAAIMGCLVLWSSGVSPRCCPLPLLAAFGIDYVVARGLRVDRGKFLRSVALLLLLLIVVARARYFRYF